MRTIRVEGAVLAPKWIASVEARRTLGYANHGSGIGPYGLYEVWVTLGLGTQHRVAFRNFQPDDPACRYSGPSDTMTETDARRWANDLVDSIAAEMHK